MENSIILNFPPKVPREERNQLTGCVNNALAAISQEVNDWSGFIDVIRSEQKGYHLVPVADNDVVRNKMQVLLETIELGAYCD